jgi:hypothetical protein
MGSLPDPVPEGRREPSYTTVIVSARATNLGTAPPPEAAPTRITFPEWRMECGRTHSLLGCWQGKAKFSVSMEMRLPRRLTPKRTALQPSGFPSARLWATWFC